MRTPRTDLELLRFLLFRTAPRSHSGARPRGRTRGPKKPLFTSSICSRSSFSSLQLIMMFLPFVLCAVYDIGYNGTCGRKLSCSASVEHRITQYISVDEDGVEDTVYAVQRVFRCQSSPGLPWRNTDHPPCGLLRAV